MRQNIVWTSAVSQSIFLHIFISFGLRALKQRLFSRARKAFILIQENIFSSDQSRFWVHWTKTTFTCKKVNVSEKLLFWYRKKTFSSDQSRFFLQKVLTLIEKITGNKLLTRKLFNLIAFMIWRKLFTYFQPFIPFNLHSLMVHILFWKY